jgi:hypothetical protein
LLTDRFVPVHACGLSGVAGAFRIAGGLRGRGAQLPAAVKPAAVDAEKIRHEQGPQTLCASVSLTPVQQTAYRERRIVRMDPAEALGEVDNAGIAIGECWAVGQVQQSVRDPGAALNRARPDATEFAVTGHGLVPGRRRDARKKLCQGDRVLYGGIGPLAMMGKHSVSGVSQEDHTAAVPTKRLVHDEETPAFCHPTCGDHLRHRFMPASKGRQRLVGLGLGRAAAAGGAVERSREKPKCPSSARRRRL